MKVYFLLYLFQQSHCLWKKGVVHYSINAKDYDVHSQDEILSTISAIQKEICIKFFMTSTNFNISNDNKVLYISNPDKRKACTPSQYDFKQKVIDMPIGYKCLNQRDIAMTLVHMLRASIKQTVSSINSNDLVKKFQDQSQDNNTSLLTMVDRNFINAHYFHECGSQSSRVPQRRFEGIEFDITVENQEYYKDKVWPLGIVLYAIDDKLRGTPDHNLLSYAITSLELASCIVFHEIHMETLLQSKNFILFSTNGEDTPNFGFQQGNQTVKLSSITNGASGHKAHILNNLMRILGVHMTSNRFDRDNYVKIHWNGVTKGMEHHLEKAPEQSWLQSIPYDFDSVTHAPANYMCSSCELGDRTVQPIQDHLWLKTLAMGQRTEPTESDIKTIHLLYRDQCGNRFDVDI